MTVIEELVEKEKTHVVKLKIHSGLAYEIYISGALEQEPATYKEFTFTLKCPHTSSHCREKMKMQTTLQIRKVNATKSLYLSHLNPIVRPSTLNKSMSPSH